MTEPSSPSASTCPAARSARPGRLGVGIISAGRVGTVLGSALRAVDHQVIGVHAVSEASSDRADILLHGVPQLSVEEIVERSELVLLAVPDDALAPLVSGLADLGRWQPGQLVAHTSGRYGTDVLEPARRAGAIPLAIHPAMTFSGTSMDLPRLVGCPMAVTAPAAVLPIAQALAVELGGEPFILDGDARPAYHAALAHGANHLLTLVTQAMRVLDAVGVDDPGQTLRPLLTAALDRALREGEAGLTGPVSRGDAGTVAAHLAELDRLAAGTGSGPMTAVDPASRRGPESSAAPALYPGPVLDLGSGAEVGTTPAVGRGSASDAATGPGCGAGPNDLADIPATYRALATATTARCQARGTLTPTQAADLVRALGHGPDQT